MAQTGTRTHFSYQKSLKGDEKNENKALLKKMIYDRNFPMGGKNQFGRYLTEMENYRNSSPQQLTANWQHIDATGSVNNDVGRTASITIDTINTGRFYICTPHSGVWVTQDNGVTYAPITESLPTQNTSCLVIDPVNTSTLYLATGTFQMDMPANSMGIFKSTDAGATWNTTGLTFAPVNALSIGDLIVNPDNNASLLAATTDGLYRTYDSGNTWTKILNDVITCVRFHPADTSLIYAMGNIFYRSSDAGNTFIANMNNIQTSFQWPYTWFLRTTNADPNIVYVFTGGGWVNPTFNTKFYIHKSTDSGQNFVLLDSLSGEVAGQIDVSQNTVDKFITGYWRVYLKTGAAPFVQISQSNTSPGLPYMHVDQRGIKFHPHNDSIIYFCNDGGLYRTSDNGQSIQNITGNMNLAHLYDFSHSQIVDKKILVSPLDVPPYMIGNSGISTTFTQFAESFASDMSPVNDNRFFITHQNPLFTINNGASFFSSNHPLIGNTYFNKNVLHYDDCSEDVCYYSSWNDIYKSVNAGASFSNFVRTGYNPMNTFISSPENFVVARANPRYIYAHYEDSVYVTTNGSNPMTNITGNLPVSSAVISHLAVDPTDENKVWVSFSGYDAGNKVYHSSDAGQTWTNMSQGLPNIPISEIAVQPGVPGAIYAGTDGGVFYTDDSFGSWQYYNTNLPNVIITGLDMQFNEGKLRISTFGRGVWESDFYIPTPANYQLPPVSVFSVSQNIFCAGEVIQPINESCGVIDSLLWLFPGGSPVSSTDYAPGVTYAAPGSYTVTLITYNSGGSDTLTLTNIIQVQTPVTVPYSEPVVDLNMFVLPQGMWAQDLNGDELTWNRGWWVNGTAGIDDDYLYYDNYNYQFYGLEEPLVMPQFDLTNTIEPKLFFYRSYKMRDPVNIDTLKIVVNACAGTDTTLWIRGGSSLATVTGIQPTGQWMPFQLQQWALDSVDLSYFAGEPSVTIKFINRSGFGQILYLDEFSVIETSTTGINEINDGDFSLFPNPATDLITIRSSRHAIEKVEIRDLLGRTVGQFKPERSPVFSTSLSSLDNGVYFVIVNESNSIRFVKQ